MFRKCIVAGCFLATLPAMTSSAVDSNHPAYALAQRFTLQQKTDGANGVLGLLMDARLTASVQEELWGEGDWSLVLSPSDNLFKEFSSLPPGSAKLTIRDHDGKLVAQRSLEKPLAKLQEWNTAHSGNREFLLTVAYSAGWGSYNGPITTLLQISNGTFHDVEAWNGKTGLAEPIHMMRSLKSDWKITKSEKGEEILTLSCHPKNDDNFVLDYSRYSFNGARWLEYKRQDKGFWESDEGFPPRAAFP
ncbi:MAG: hypothetical protein WAO35_11315 [Terriglobia bacterium]